MIPSSSKAFAPIDRLLPMAALLLCLLVAWWIVTAGTGHPFKPYDLILATFYDAQAESLLSGRLDVPCSAIRKEAFIIDGRCYGYFGITPALFRLPLNALFPAYRGHWGTLSVTSAYLLLLLSSYGLCTTMRRHLLGPDTTNAVAFAVLSSVLILAIGLGSTSIFLLSRPVLHHEAIIWASALGLSGLLCALHHVLTVSRSSLLLAVILGLLAINARPPAGLMAAFAAGVAPIARACLRPSTPSQTPAALLRRLLPVCCTRAALIGLFGFALIVASYAAINYAKFTSISGVPLRYYASSSPALLDRLHGSFFHLANIPWNLTNQFSAEGLRTTNAAPYLQLQFRLQGMITRQDEEQRFPSALIFGIEPFIGIPIGMTTLLLMSVAGTFLVLKLPHRAVLMALLATTLVGPFVSLIVSSISYRYLHEYLPLFAFTGALFLSHIAGAVRSPPKLLLLAPLALTFLNVVINIAFAVIYQSTETNLGAPLRQMPDALYQFVAPAA